MNCPYCGKKLIKSKTTKQYETLVEHVGDPNGPVMEKSYYYCNATGCIMNHENTSYAPYGDWFGDFYCNLSQWHEVKDIVVGGKNSNLKIG